MPRGPKLALLDSAVLWSALVECCGVVAPIRQDNESCTETTHREGLLVFPSCASKAGAGYLAVRSFAARIVLQSSQNNRITLSLTLLLHWLRLHASFDVYPWGTAFALRLPVHAGLGVRFVCG